MKNIAILFRGPLVVGHARCSENYRMAFFTSSHRSDIWEYTIEAGLGTPSIKQIVVYFYSSHDNKQYSLEDGTSEERTLQFNFTPIKVWEIKKESIIREKLVGLYPLLPLMEREERESDERVIEIAMETINTVANEALHADLLSVMSILATERFSSELIKKYIGSTRIINLCVQDEEYKEVMLMNSPIYNEWIEEERKEAAEKAALGSAKKYIIDLLAAKFDFVPKFIREGIQSLDDIDVLDELLKKIIKINSLDEFKELLEKAKSIE